MRNQKGFTLVDLAVVLVVVLVAILGIGGWIANIVKLVGADFVFSGMIVARVAGIFVPPLGAVMGFL